LVKTLNEFSVDRTSFCFVFADSPRLKLTKAQEIDIGVFALFYVDVLNIRGSNVLVNG
jgi:hypothetical protein